MDRNYIAENDASRAELKRVVQLLEDVDFDRKLPNGWTVSSVLCHLAFWDECIVGRLEQWEERGFEPFQLSGQAVAYLNQSVAKLSQVVPGRKSAELVIQAAETADGKVAKLSDELCGKLESTGFERMLRRSLHRREHTEKIRALLDK